MAGAVEHANSHQPRRPCDQRWRGGVSGQRQPFAVLVSPSPAARPATREVMRRPCARLQETNDAVRQWIVRVRRTNLQSLGVNGHVEPRQPNLTPLGIRHGDHPLRRPRNRLAIDSSDTLLRRAPRQLQASRRASRREASLTRSARAIGRFCHASPLQVIRDVLWHCKPRPRSQQYSPHCQGGSGDLFKAFRL